MKNEKPFYIRDGFCGGKKEMTIEEIQSELNRTKEKIDELCKDFNDEFINVAIVVLQT